MLFHTLGHAKRFVGNNADATQLEREFFIDNLLVQIHYIIVRTK